jgi:hypothetical protein
MKGNKMAQEEDNRQATFNRLIDAAVEMETDEDVLVRRVLSTINTPHRPRIWTALLMRTRFAFAGVVIIGCLVMITGYILAGSLFIDPGERVLAVSFGAPEAIMSISTPRAGES